MAEENKPNLPEQPGEIEAAARGIPQFVTDLKTVERQVGEHVITALQHPQTVAVISAVMPGGRTNQRVVSVALNQNLFQQVQELIAEAQQSLTEPEPEIPCIGFHCVLEDRKKDQQKDSSDSTFDDSPTDKDESES